MSQNPRIYLNLGKLYIRQGKMAEALNIYQEGIKITSDNSELLTQMGLLCLKTGDSNKAFQYFATALSADGKNIKALMALGSISQEKSDIDAALLKYKQAHMLNPNSAQLWNNIGMCYYSKNNHLIVNIRTPCI